MFVGDGQSCGEVEARFADIAFPANRVSPADRLFDERQQRVHRQVEEGVAVGVVGHVEHHVLAEGTVGVAGQGHILVGQAHAMGKFAGGIFCAIHELIAGHGTNLVVECLLHFLRKLRPADAAVGCHVGHVGQLALQHPVVALVAVVAVVAQQSVFHDAVDEPWRHAPQADGAVVAAQVAVEGELPEQVARHKVGREVHRVALHDVLGLNGGQHGIGPAEVAVALVLDGSDGQ